MTMPSNGDGATALVTGAGRGIGRGIALALGRAGYRLAINDVADVDETVAQLAAIGAEAFPVRADIRNAEAVSAMVASVSRRFGQLTVLVNNAGVQTWAPFLDVSEDEWDRVIDTNLKGTFLCTQAAAREMKVHGGGTIINVGSGCNKVPFPQLAAYSVSKGGVEMLTKVCAVELGRFGIRVNCVAPGAVEVERTRLESPDYGDRWARITPLSRVGTPLDVGRAVVFLASDDASFVNGQTLWLDGGLFTQPRWAYDDEKDQNR